MGYADQEIFWRATYHSLQLVDRYSRLHHHHCVMPFVSERVASAIGSRKNTIRFDKPAQLFQLISRSVKVEPTPGAKITKGLMEFVSQTVERPAAFHPPQDGHNLACLNFQGLMERIKQVLQALVKVVSAYYCHRYPPNNQISISGKS
jgi:hypothetical protein